ncbi:MAG: hypothetical protein ACI9K1_000758 [Arcticibacterium sp.]|jgi:hypothetical protein
MIRWTSFGCLLLVISTANAQKIGYLQLNDSSISYAYGLRFDSKTPGFVYATSPKKETIVFSSKEILSFGFRDSTKFLSKEILIDNVSESVFLELLNKGDVGLYRLGIGSKSEFFIEDELISRLEKSSFREILSGYISKCEKLQGQLNQVIYTERSLRDFLNIYNSGDCRNVRFMNYGLSLGYGKSSIFLTDGSFNTSSYEGEGFDMSSSNYSVGAYIEFPIWKVRNASLLSSLHYSENIFITSQSNTFFNKDFKYEYSRVNLSIIPKYTFNTRKIGYFIGLGPSVTNTIKLDSEVFTAVFEPGLVRFERLRSISEPHQYLIGVTGLVGIQFIYGKGKCLSLEFANSRLIGNRYSIANSNIVLRGNL